MVNGTTVGYVPGKEKWLLGHPADQQFIKSHSKDHYMKLLIAFAVLLALLVTGITHSTHTEAATNCTDKTAIDKLIEDRKLVTLIQSITASGKIDEIMITPLYNREIMVIEYDPEVDLDKRPYCVISVTRGSKANDWAIDLLYNALEKVRGHRA